MSASRSRLRCLAWLLALLGAAVAAAAPAQIIFLRHAEKPDSGIDLSEKGRERAQALVALFTQDARALEHGPAAVIYAMKQARLTTSARPIQTIEPTARALGLTVDARFTRDEVSAVARALLMDPRADGKTVIVCWEHDAIPKILAALGWRKGPDQWPGKSYDRLWVLDFAGGRPARFRDLPQRLLPGDKKK
ncbi:MAG: hypothetical protein HZA93_04250 [Verrucomicrobia bacterium]|nr:hypothetical protein [Verrucomicrobiota bacterium]